VRVRNGLREKHVNHCEPSQFRRGLSGKLLVVGPCLSLSVALFLERLILILVIIYWRKMSVLLKSARRALGTGATLLIKPKNGCLSFFC